MWIKRWSVVQVEGCWRGSSEVMRNAAMLGSGSETSFEEGHHEEGFEARAQVICSKAIRFL